ncbi:MAG: hypothetical protein HDQ87_10615 [Clostridia bacterium]|nr:hypothetical protein [Clostridia bacterium]
MQTRTKRSGVIRAGIICLALMMAMMPAAVLAAERTWAEVLAQYPDKQVEVLTATLDTTYWRSWQDADAELSEQGMTIEVFSARGALLPLSGTVERIATGQNVCMYHRDYPGGARLFTVVNKGDVTGSGQLNITQLVRMAEALTDRRQLTGVYALAGDITGNGEIDLMDLAYLALWLRDSLAGTLQAKTATAPIFTIPDMTVSEIAALECADGELISEIPEI